MKLTPWFPAEVTPVRAGVYEVEKVGGNYGGLRWYSYWNGKNWMWHSQSVGCAFNCRDLDTRAITLQWRGLAEDPSKVGAA